MAVVANISENAVFIDLDHLKNAALCYEEKFFPLCPSVFEGVGVNFALFNVFFVLFIILFRYWIFNVRVFVLIKKKIIVFVLLCYSVREKVFDFLQVHQSIHIRHLVLFWVVVNLAVVKLVIVFYSAICFLLAPDEEVGQDIVLGNLLNIHLSVMI